MPPMDATQLQVALVMPAGKLSITAALLTPLGPLVMKLTPRARIPLFTPDSLHALRFAPSVSHYKAATELGYRVRPIHETVADTLRWFADQRR